MTKSEIKEWVVDNVWHYEPEWDEYELDQAVNDMLYNFFTDELDMDVDPHDEENYEWEHKEFLISEFRKEWKRNYE